MKKKINKFLFMVLLSVAMVVSAGIFSFSNAIGNAFALSGNGGIVYVGNNAIYNHTSGTMSGGTATNGGAVYIASGGTLNLSGGSVNGNSATTTGNNIYNVGTFNMTGGTVGISGTSSSGYGIYNTGTMNLYGGHVYDMIYSSTSFNTKMAATLHEEISITDSATITVQDYAGTTPTYKIKLTNSRSFGTIVTFLGNKTTSPDISKFTVTGYNSDYDIVIRKNSNGYFELALTTMEFPSDWKTQVSSTTYMTTTVTPANLTSIKFVSSVPSGYTKIGTLSTGLPVYKGTTATEIAFVAKSIYAPVNSSNLFKDLRKLTTIDFAVFKTGNVTNMAYMFSNCSSLTSLDLSKFDTAKVTDMYGMFYSCSAIVSLNVSNFNTTKVKNMYRMFYNCSSLSTMSLSNFDTSNVTNMGLMFYSCSSLTSLDLSKFDTSNVTGMNGMFYSCSKLTSLDVSSFNTSKVTDMSAMFQGCSRLTSLNISNFNTSKVIYMSYMFYNCSNLTSIDVSKFDTSKVTTMAGMFSLCSNLTSINISNFNTSKVTSMSSMFNGCSSLTSLDLSSFNMSNVTNSSDMLNFGTAAVIRHIKTPYNNTSAIAITTGTTLYNVSTEEVATGVLAGTTSSQTLATRFTLNLDANGGSCSVSSLVAYYYCSLTNVGKSLPTATQSGYTFSGWYTERTGGTRIYDSTPLTYTTTTTLYAHWTENTPTPDPDPDPPTPPSPDPDQPSGSVNVDGIKYLVFTTPNNVPSGLNQSVQIDYNSRSAFVEMPSDPTIYANEDGTRVAFVGNPGELIAPTDCSNLFAELESLEWVIFRNYDTFYSTNFSNMFQGCTSLEFVDMLSIQTPSVTAMDYMFQGCSVLKQIALAKFDCINLVSASYMFNGCINLGNNPVYSGTVSLGGTESVVIDSFPVLEYTYNLQDAQYMFADSNWPTFYMPYFFTDSLSNVTGMFENCNVDILDLSQFVCKNFDPSGIVGSGSLNPSAVYTPRNCRTSSFMSIFGSRTYTLPNGESIGIFDDLGYEGTIPFSLCFVDTDSNTIGHEVYQFTLVYNEWGFDELNRLIRDMLEFSGISSFSGDVNNLTISTFSPLRDVYYLLPIPYGIDESTSEEAFAGWVGVSDGTTSGGGVPTDELFYNDFTGYNNFFGGSGHLMAVGWVDAMIDGPNSNNYGDVSSGVTPYTEWYNNQRNRLARVRYLPSCHGTDGQIFRGWYNENIGFISYYSNIAPLSDAGGPAWWESMTVGFHDLGSVQEHDYWELPSGNSSFVSNASSQEKDLERMMNLYETNKQEILIPDDKKVTITELKLKKVS